MNPSRKLLVLALDAASPGLLRSWSADGTLPNIAQLMATGLVGDSRSVDGLFDGATWPSFYTGHSPAGHGCFWLDQLKRGTYRVQACGPADFGRRPALWETLSDAGRRVLVLDVPLARKSPRIDGAQLVEWGCHDAIFGYQSTPTGVAREVLQRVGSHPAPEPCDAPTRTPAEFRDFAARLGLGAAAKARMTRQLLSERPWDFAIQVFSESHCGGHQLWHLHDPSHPGFDPVTTDLCGDLVRQVYVAVDAAIGEIVDSLDAETSVVLLDLHGMAVPHGANLLLPEMLTRLGVMHRPPLEPSGRAAVLPGGRVRRGLRAAYHRIPQRIRAPLYDARQRFNQGLGLGSLIDLDWSRSQCFDLPVGAAFGAIRLNLKGREPAGTLTPGPEAELFCERLTHDLLEVVRPETGRRLVRQVLRTADLYRGAYSEDLPDLLIEWDPEHKVGSAPVGGGAGALLRAQSPRIGLIEVLNTNCRTGQHEPEGLFVARGPGIGVGRLGRVVSTLDLAPTFAKRLGCEMSGVEGSPIPELLA